MALLFSHLCGRLFLLTHVLLLLKRKKKEKEEKKKERKIKKKKGGYLQYLSKAKEGLQEMKHLCDPGVSRFSLLFPCHSSTGVHGICFLCYSDLENSFGFDFPIAVSSMQFLF